MREDHTGITAAVARDRLRLRAAAALLCLLAGLVSLGALSSPALAARHAAKHACGITPRPGSAACLAMRLLIEASASGQAQPAFAGGAAAIADSKPFPGFLTPAKLHEAYGLPEETAAGSGQTIAVVDAFDDPSAEADLAVYDKQFGLPACTTENGCFKKVDQEGKASPLPKEEGGWASEISIDVQMAHAICQNCHILLVETNSEEFSDLGAGVSSAAALGATEISNSYGGTEDPSDSTVASAYDHPGVVLAASSGDCGYENKACAGDPVGANFPAAAPAVVAVGGTSLSESAGVWTSTVWEEGGSACSTVFSGPLWQVEAANFSATGCGGDRGIADVSAIGDPNTGVDVYDSTPEEPGGPVGWGVWGGTSVAAPIVAAEWALAGGAGGVSYPAATLYGHFAGGEGLYDVLAGKNGSCGKATICKAAAGFDGPTGVGSPVGLEAFSVAGLPHAIAPPTIVGAPEQGLALTEHHGEWSGEPTSYALQWERCDAAGCRAILSATGSTYTPTAADVGATIRVRESAHNTIGSFSADSAKTQTVVSDVPTLSGFAPASGITGGTIVLEGTALSGATQVQLGKLSAPFTVVSPSKLEVTVPDGAAKGKLIVTTPFGIATSRAKFTPTLAIRSFKPVSGLPATLVTIKGVGFTPSSTVSFAGTPATSVTYSSQSKLKAIVPAGASSGQITVTNTVAPVGTVASPTAFVP
jgi:hypothetical protein